MKMQIGEIEIEQHNDGWVSLTHGDFSVSFRQFEVEYHLNELIEKAEVEMIRAANDAADAERDSASQHWQSL